MRPVPEQEKEREAGISVCLLLLRDKPKQLGEERAICLSSWAVTEEKQNRMLDAAADVETTEEGCLLACSPPLAQPASSTSQDQ